MARSDLNSCKCRTLTRMLTKHSTIPCISAHLWISVATVCFVFGRVFDACGCIVVVNSGMGCGSSWSTMDLETLESDVSSGKSAGAIANDRGWPISSVRQNVAALKRRDPAPRYVGTCRRRAIRLLRLRPIVIRTVLHLDDRHIYDRRKFAEEMLARLAEFGGDLLRVGSRSRCFHSQAEAQPFSGCTWVTSRPL